MAGYIGSKASVVSSGVEHKKTFTITGATTSLTGLNYTVGKVHVFQNGVRLVDGTDYTATNGTTITLTVAAQSGDNVVVISQASYQVALSGIDDQSNATAITIDSNENVLIGKTSADGTGSTGHDIRATGLAYHTVDGGDVKVLNRLNSDGGILSLRKDGTTVGSIGVNSGDLMIGTGDVGMRFSDGEDSFVPSTITGNTNRDNAIDLGKTSSRFKDLYLSGGVYLGGTSSAHKLDDYEEGTFALNNAGDGTGVVASTGKYVKIGRQVTVHAIANVTTNFTSQAMDGLPFAPSHVTTFSSIHGAAVCIGANVFAVNCNSGLTRVEFRNTSHAATAPTTGPIRFTLVYQTT